MHRLPKELKYVGKFTSDGSIYIQDFKLSQPTYFIFDKIITIEAKIGQ